MREILWYYGIKVSKHAPTKDFNGLVFEKE